MRITAVSILDRKTFDEPDDAIKQDIDGHQISGVARRGKALILFLREPSSKAGSPAVCSSIPR